MTKVARAECQELGIPPQLIPVFRDYVMRTNRRDIDLAPAEVRMAVLAGLADAFLATRGQEAKRSRTGAKRDEEQRKRSKRRRHKGKRDPIPEEPDPRKLGAVPSKGLLPGAPPSMARQGFGNPGSTGPLRESTRRVDVRPEGGGELRLPSKAGREPGANVR